MQRRLPSNLVESHSWKAVKTKQRLLTLLQEKTVSSFNPDKSDGLISTLGFSSNPSNGHVLAKNYDQD